MVRGNRNPIGDPPEVRPEAGVEPADGALLERFVARRDEAAFSELVRRHGPMVLGVCRRVLDSAEDVEDAFQATFMVLGRKAGSIRKRESAASWLYGVALRVARRARASLGRRREHERRAAAARPLAESPPEATWEELRPALDDALDRLPAKYRVLVILCYLEGKTYDEAARLLRVAKGTVSTRLTQARTLLRRQLRRSGVALSVGLLASLLELNAAPPSLPPAFGPRAVAAARCALGAGGEVSPRVASLADGALSGRGKVGQAFAAVLAVVAIGVVGGVFLWSYLAHRRDGQPEDAPAQVWQERATLPGHLGMAWNPIFSPDGKVLTTQASEPAPRLWDLAAGRVTAVLPREDNQFHMALGFTPDGREIVTAGPDTRAWEVATGKERARFDVGGLTTRLAADGKSLAGIGPDGKVHVFDVAERRERAAWGGFAQPVKALAITPDGAALAAGDGSGAITVWDLKALNQRRLLPGNGVGVMDLALSPDGTTLAAVYGLPDGQAGAEGAPPREVKLWSLVTGEAVTLAPHLCSRAVFSPDGGLLATTGGGAGIDLWDPRTGEHRLKLPGMVQSQLLMHVPFSPDGKAILVPGLGGTAQLRDTRTGMVLATIRGHTGTVADAAFSADGRLLATGSSTWQQGGRQAEMKVWERLP